MMMGVLDIHDMVSYISYVSARRISLLLQTCDAERKFGVLFADSVCLSDYDGSK